MPRGPAPSWRARKPPVTDAHLLKAIELAGGIGSHHPQTGHYRTLFIRGFTTRDEAMEWKRSLHRCALWLARHHVADISVAPTIRRTGNRYEIEFAVYDKTAARAYTLATYGEDKSKWPYDPTRKGRS